MEEISSVRTPTWEHASICIREFGYIHSLCPEVSMFRNTRCTTMAVSSTFFPRTLLSSSKSLSRWPQKNSGSSGGRSPSAFTRASRPSVAVLGLQLAQSNAECMMARRMQQAAGESARSGDGTASRAVGWPKQCPVWVTSVLWNKERKGECR